MTGAVPQGWPEVRVCPTSLPVQVRRAFAPSGADSPRVSPCTNYYQATGCSETATVVQTTQGLSAGTHLLVFKIWDTDGNVCEAEKTVTVN